jgi:hypothetical protein
VNAAELAGIQAAVVAAEDRRYAAMVAGDTAALADLLSETLIYVHTTGDTDTRQSYLDAVDTGFVDYRHLERRDERWAIRPGSVLSAGRQLGLSVLQGRPGLIDVAYLSAWAPEEGRWRLAAWHATRYAPTR